jgi:hypothetical protein
MRLDELNGAFIDYGNAVFKTRLRKYLNEIDSKLKGDIKKADIKKAIEDSKLTFDVRVKVASAMILSDIQSVITAQRVSDVGLAIALIAKYRKPERIAQAVEKEMILVFKGEGNKAYAEYVGKRAKVITSVSINLGKEMNRIIQFIKTDLSRNILSKYDDLQKQGLDTQEIKTELKKTFQDADKRIERIVQTEGHAINEKTKLLLNGDKEFKVWVTQGDDRVRDTTFHNGVEGMRVRVEDDFEVAGIKAAYPSDYSLPIEERVNCRCFLTFTST